ncbi:type I-E CRISPR-associated protein Cas6/Cse3/CasE [Glycomyces sp. A-F 0318]|uniref:type I-E CRISPR-associated protein Cas6/Cse3/CasE n=1 Tax=Glycomyces amatae TaxID=2881355 RepID=UPI001E56C517|nr:type I-E CRISPR-associated protein Cas6/Cse3/CasE [Glycomyces amatae]MCD0444217.1 type I-E CRISPR-associated protein Cas6/Cse3/CasE [Glycomyces amatae]
MSPWLTRLVLDPRHRGIRTLLADGGRQHTWLMHLAPDHLGDQPRRAAGLLYRIEDSSRGPVILVQTATEPLLDALPMDGVIQAATRKLAPQLDALHTGAKLRYRIVANPTKRWGNSAPEPALVGKLHVFHGPAALTWWTDRAPAAGLAIESTDWRPLDDTIINGRTRHARAQFDGTATITDPDMLREAVRTGIGRSQSYGCGLLSLALLTPVTERSQA